ncbi:Fe(3+)-hydroxamate ABC transporter permease FhuB [Chelatococcus reniformis]|uniref:Fe3+-hydroxamate ABC transporter permease FhuB n=1 Tax=Chelatococcus reniformis TaxID=1494448 RepID=A0A916XND7_9HYPH|nr:Fe(3+)-hydroxamate ABC transporter permease FhuB [Chelatococcus reniformis]GGC89013.1 Fe3+-hydroxamate ABC transporter permease FhuB [Chelatococcus reniformis]
MAERALPSRSVAPLALLAGALACLALALTAATLEAALPARLWWAALTSHGATVPALIFADVALPRVVVSWIVGAGLALAGVLLQQALRNPLADTTTLGISAGAYLALAAASLFAPALLAAGQEAVALAASLAVAAIVLAVARRGDLSPVALILAGLTLSLLCGSAAAVLTVLNHDYLSTLFVWQSGSLVQNGWGPTRRLAVALAFAGAAAAALSRPLMLLELAESQGRALGLRVGAARAAAVAVAAAIGAACVSAVGVVGFIGIVAPQIAQRLGARTLRQKLTWAPAFGALLLWIADQGVQHLAFLRTEIPVGSATALLGAPVLLLIVLQHKPRGVRNVRPATAPVRPRARHPRRAVVALCALFALSALVAMGLGRTMTGWGWLSADTAGLVLPWRAPRVIAAGSAGAMLAVAGLLLQRMTGNPMASPEVLGVSSGAALGIVILLFIVADFSQPLMIAAAAGGALAALLLIVGLNGRAGLAVDRLLLVGVALATGFSAFAAVLLTSGDPRSAILLAWLSGSTYRATLAGAVAAALFAVVVIAAAGATARWLAILPLGPATAAAIGVPARASRLVLLSAIAALTAAATMVVGPLSFIGLLGPHLVRLAGIERPLDQLMAAAAAGGALLVAADWLGRNLFFPWEVPAGLCAALIGGPVCLALLRGRPA